MKSIKQKLLVYFGGIAIIICLGLSIVSYTTTSKILNSGINEDLNLVAKQSSEIINEKFKSELNSLEVLSRNEKICNMSIPFEKKKYILDDIVKNKSFLLMGVADLNGNTVFTNGASSNIKDREYFQKAIQGTSNISDPLVSKNSRSDKESITVTYAVPIKNGEKTVGVLVADRDGNEISQLVKDIKYGQNSDVFIINNKGTTIAHKDKEKVYKMENVTELSKKDENLKELADVHKKMIAGEVGVQNYDYKGTGKYIGYSPIGDLGWSFGMTVPASDITAGLKHQRNLIFITCLIFLSLGLLFIYIISKRLSEAMVFASNQLDEIATGDLTVEVPEEYLKIQDEIGQMAVATNEMQINLKNMISIIKENANVINESAETLSATSEETSAAAGEVANTVQNVSKGSEEQSDELVNINNILNDFGENLDEIAQLMNDVTNNTKEISKMSTESNESMQYVIKSVNNVSDSFDDFESKITGLGENIGKINEITDLINNIAEQTNLLALNAAIEAARAGEAGKGFTVVADEIRKLAEESKSSVEDINSLIGSISKDSNLMMESSEEMSIELKDQIEKIVSTIKVFENINTAVEDVLPKINNINSSADDIINDKENIAKQVGNISEVSENVAASSEEIAASTEELNASSEEVASVAQSLTKMTQEMIAEVSKFKL